MFWVGVLYGTVFTSAVAFFPAAIRFFRIDPFVYLGAGGVITGFIAGNGVKDGAKAGFLSGIIIIIAGLAKGLIFDRSGYSSITPFLLVTGMIDLILIIPVPVAVGGVIGGWIRQLIKNIWIMYVKRFCLKIIKQFINEFSKFKAK